MELEGAKIKSQSDGVDKISISQTKSGERERMEGHEQRKMEGRKR